MSACTFVCGRVCGRVYIHHICMSCPVHCVCPNLHTASAWSTGCMLVQAFLLDLVCIMFRTVGAGRQPGAFLPPQDSSLSTSLPFRSRNLSSIRLSSSLSTHVLGSSSNQPRISTSSSHQTLSLFFLHSLINELIMHSLPQSKTDTSLS